MNRAEREEAKKSQQQREFEALIRHYHLALFPEEYDHVYDSGVEAKERKQGINPMSQAYQDEVTKRRAAFGFGPYYVDDNGQLNPNTLEWVQQQLSLGKQEHLDRLIAIWFDN